MEKATLAGGCFWCTEAVFRQIKGVEKVVPGYAGGKTADPTYEEVCAGTTGHAEAVQVTFDPSVIPYRTLLWAFFSSHDSTTKDRQGADVGAQYRSAIFCHSEEQRRIAEDIITELNDSRAFGNPVVTEVKPIGKFYEAEGYHYDYYAKNRGEAYCRIVISPKLAKFRMEHREMLKG